LANYLVFVFFFFTNYIKIYFPFVLEGMNEDGSFIGQYGRKGRSVADANAAAFATLV
jgi:hypothetical protein